MSAKPQIPVISKVSFVVVFGAFMVLSATGLGLVTRYLLIPALVSGMVPPTWSWSGLWLLEFGMLITFLLLGANIYRAFSTRILPKGVSYPTLHGRCLLEWSKVERAMVQGYEIHLYSGRSVAKVNVACFTEPDQVFAFINSRLPAHVAYESDPA